jgi:hypothetical protein
MTRLNFELYTSRKSFQCYPSNSLFGYLLHCPNILPADKREPSSPTQSHITYTSLNRHSVNVEITINHRTVDSSLSTFLATRMELRQQTINNRLKSGACALAQ